MQLRPGLAAALKEARAARCPLIVSRLDRLSRNVHFITGLMEHKVHFVVAALGRGCDGAGATVAGQAATQWKWGGGSSGLCLSQADPG